MLAIESVLRFVLKKYQNPLTVSWDQREALIEVRTKGASASRCYKARLFSRAMAALYSKGRPGAFPDCEELDNQAAQLLERCAFNHFDFYYLEGEYLRLQWAVESSRAKCCVTDTSLEALLRRAVAGELSCDIDVGCRLRLHHQEPDCEQVGPVWGKDYEGRVERRRHARETDEDMLAVIAQLTLDGHEGVSVTKVRAAFKKTRHGWGIVSANDVMHRLFVAGRVRYIDGSPRLVCIVEVSSEV